MNNLILFILVQFLNVILSTIKSVITVNGKPVVAGVVNAFYFSLYYCIIKLITNEDLFGVVIVTFFTNLIGVVIGKRLVDMFEKDKLWVYNCFIRCNEMEAISIKNDFEDNGCYCIYESIKEGKFYSFKILSNKKQKSCYVVNKLSSLNAKYFVIESRKNGYQENN